MSVTIFFCYAHEDEALLKQLKAQLIPLQRQRLIDLWHDRDISAGSEWEQEISQHLNAAQIILLLVSPDFMASNYCYGIEMKRARERHQRGEARVIPIILRPVDWQGILGDLQALPTNAKPVKSWLDLDEAFLDVEKGIRKVVEELGIKNFQAMIKDSQAMEANIQNILLHHTMLVPATWQEQLAAWEAVSPTAPSPQPTKPPSFLKPEALSLLRTLSGHTVPSSFNPQSRMITASSSVTSVAFSPDSQTLASGSWDQTIKLWNLASG